MLAARTCNQCATFNTSAEIPQGADGTAAKVAFHPLGGRREVVYRDSLVKYTMVYPRGVAIHPPLDSGPAESYGDEIGQSCTILGPGNHLLVFSPAQ